MNHSGGSSHREQSSREQRVVVTTRTMSRRTKRSASKDSQQSPTNQLPACMRETQPFFAEGTLVPNDDDSNTFNIKADLLLPRQRQLRIKVELRACLNDVIVEQTETSKSANTPEDFGNLQETDEEKESDSPGENKTVEGETGSHEKPQPSTTPKMNGKTPDRHVSWFPSDVRRRLEFSTSPSGASVSQVADSSEQPQSTSTPNTAQRHSPSTFSTDTADSVPTASEPTFPEQSATADSLQSGQTSADSSETTRGFRRLQKAINAGRVDDRPRRRRSKSAKSGLVFPVTRIGRNLKDGGYTGNRCRKDATIALAAIIETVTGDLLEIAGNKAHENNRTRIQPQDIKDAVKDDEDFQPLLRDVHIPLNPPKTYY